MLGASDNWWMLSYRLSIIDDRLYWCDVSRESIDSYPLFPIPYPLSPIQRLPSRYIQRYDRGTEIKFLLKYRYKLTWPLWTTVHLF